MDTSQIDLDELLAISLFEEESNASFECTSPQVKETKETSHNEKTTEIQEMNKEYQKYLQIDIQNQKKKINESIDFEELSPRTLRQKRCQYYDSH
jgi:hypothetical protein